MTLHETWAIIGGRRYGIRYDDSGLIHETMCQGHWPWSKTPGGPATQPASGSLWLDSQMIAAVNRNAKEEK